MTVLMHRMLFIIFFKSNKTRSSITCEIQLLIVHKAPSHSSVNMRIIQRSMQGASTKCSFRLAVWKPPVQLE